MTGSLVTVEEGTGGWSWGTEIAAVMSERLLRPAAPPGLSRGQRTHRHPVCRGRGSGRCSSARPQIETAILEAAK